MEGAEPHNLPLASLPLTGASGSLTKAQRGQGAEMRAQGPRPVPARLASKEEGPPSQPYTEAPQPTAPCFLFYTDTPGFYLTVTVFFVQLKH